MSKSNEEAPQVYYIPGNYEDSGGVLGGRLGTRNAVELCVICGPIAFLEFKLLHFSIQTNLIIAIVTLLPLAALCIFGIGGETLSQILFALIRYFRKRRLLHYDKFTPVEETTAAGAFSLDKFLDIASSSGVKAAVAKFQEDREGNTQADTQKKKKKAVKQKKKRTSGAAGGDGDQEIRDELRRQEREIKGQTKAHEFKRACAQIGGSYIRISSGSNDCINIMEIRPEVNPIAEYLDESDMEAGSWLAKKATQLITFFHLLIPDLSNEEEQLADEAIIKTYNRYGITHDNKSIYKEDGSPRLMPIIGDLHQTLAEREEMRRVANILARFVSGSAQSFNRRTNVDLDNKFIVFDLQDLSGNLKSIGMFVVMDFLWSRIKEDRTERKAIFIDEAWQLIGASTDKSVADFVHRIFKIIRGYGGAAILATQDVSDLFAYQDGKFGKAILSNSKTKIILQLEQVEAEALQNSMELSKAEIRDIINFERGQAMICSNNNKVPVQIRASTVEHELITTDPTQLRAIVEKRKREVAQPVPVAPQVSQEPSPDGEEIVDTGYDKKLEDEKRERAKKAAKEAAVLEAQAVEQIADNRYAQMPTGERIPVEGETPLLPTDDIYEDADVEEDSPGAQMPIHAPVDAATKPLYQGDFDRDLADAEDGGEEETERSVQYGNHPPIDF